MIGPLVQIILVLILLIQVSFMAEQQAKYYKYLKGSYQGEEALELKGLSAKKCLIYSSISVPICVINFYLLKPIAVRLTSYRQYFTFTKISISVSQKLSTLMILVTIFILHFLNTLTSSPRN